MSRLGKRPITLPAGVEASFADGVLTVKGPKGTLTRSIKDVVTVTVEGDQVTVAPVNDSKEARSLWGTYASHVINMAHGVSEGFSKVLEIEGVGYRAEIKGSSIALSVGFSHPVEIPFPEGVTAVVEKSVITVSGIDKEEVGQYAANIRKIKKPEPYKGKGIRYQGEYIIRKQGKKAV